MAKYDTNMIHALVDWQVYYMVWFWADMGHEITKKHGLSDSFEHYYFHNPIETIP